MTVTFFILGATIGGLLLGSFLAGAASIVGRGSVSVTVPLLVLSVAALWELSGLGVPSLARQVDENWLPRYRGWVYGLGFGVQLGLGFITYVTTPLTYGFALAVVLSGEPLIGLITGSSYGLTRGLSLLASMRASDPSKLRLLFRTLDRARSFSRVAGAALVLFVVAQVWLRSA